MRGPVIGKFTRVVVLDDPEAIMEMAFATVGAWSARRMIGEVEAEPGT